MKRLRTWTRVVCLAAVISPGTALATNGMYMIGYGAISRSMGGVGIAYGRDTLASAQNPAALSDVSGMRGDVGATLFLPRATAAIGNYAGQSVADLYVIPSMGAAVQLSPRLWAGFTMVGAGGGGSRYNRNLIGEAAHVGSPQKALGVSLFLAQANPTVAYKLGRHNAFGASLVFGIQQFRAFGLTYFARFTPSGHFARLTNRGNDWAYGVGVRVGWRGSFLADRLDLGAVYTTKTYMTQFDKYSELFAGHGRFDTPSSFGVGVAVKITPKLMAELDVVRMLYSGVPAVSNTGPNVNGEDGGVAWPTNKAANALGEDQGLGFGWKNQTIYKVGLSYALNDQLTLRGGWNYGKSPIDQTREILFNVLAPATVQYHVTLGATYHLNAASSVTFAYVHAFNFQQFGPTYIGQLGTIKMHQNSFGISYGLQM